MLSLKKMSSPQLPAHDRSISRSSFGSFKSNDSSSFRSIDSFSELFPTKASPPATTNTTNTAGATTAKGDAEDVKARRQDWKLDANELSLIRREEERVMKPEVLGKLLAAGASLECEPRGFGAASVGVVVGGFLLTLGVECSAMDPKGVAKDEHRRDGSSCRFCAYGTGASRGGCFIQPALSTTRPYHPS